MRHRMPRSGHECFQRAQGIALCVHLMHVSNRLRGRARRLRRLLAPEGGSQTCAACDAHRCVRRASNATTVARMRRRGPTVACGTRSNQELGGSWVVAVWLLRERYGTSRSRSREQRPSDRRCTGCNAAADQIPRVWVRAWEAPREASRISLTACRSPQRQCRDDAPCPDYTMNAPARAPAQGADP